MVLVSKSLFVDLANGNNGTATRERLDLPYLTIAAAKTAYTPIIQLVGGRIGMRSDLIKGNAPAIDVQVDSTTSPAVLILVANDAIGMEGPAANVVNGHFAYFRDMRLTSLVPSSSGHAVDVPTDDASDPETVTLHNCILVAGPHSCVSIRGPIIPPHQPCRIYGTVMANRDVDSTIDLIGNTAGFVNDPNVT